MEIENFDFQYLRKEGFMVIVQLIEYLFDIRYVLVLFFIINKIGMVLRICIFRIIEVEVVLEIKGYFWLFGKFQVSLGF